jgi:hypothetical protein
MTEGNKYIEEAKKVLLEGGHTEEAIKSEFLINEVERLVLIEKTILDRLSNLIDELPAAWKKKKVWEFTQLNIPRMLVMKAMLGQLRIGELDLADQLKQDPDIVLINSADSFTQFDLNTLGEPICGGYLVYDTITKTWKRSGKAIHCVGRLGDHTKAKNNLQSRQGEKFYRNWHAKWDQLEWYRSVSFVGNQLQAARLFHYPKEVRTWFIGTKWLGKGNAETNPVDKRKIGFFGYLVELVDDLLLDKRCTADASESVGFESVLKYGNKQSCV